MELVYSNTISTIGIRFGVEVVKSEALPCRMHYNDDTIFIIGRTGAKGLKFIAVSTL